MTRKGRAQISVSKAAYNKAKKVQEQYREQGVIITMEQALVISKQVDEGKKTFTLGWGL